MCILFKKIICWLRGHKWADFECSLDTVYFIGKDRKPYNIKICLRCNKQIEIKLSDEKIPYKFIDLSVKNKWSE